MTLPATSVSRLAALSLVMFLPSLGISIANVALPAIADAFHISFRTVQWVVIAYLLGVTVLVVSVGRLGDHYGRRRLLLGGIAIFTLAALAGALAGDLRFLALCRGVQGLGAAVMMSLTVAAVSDAVPAERAGSAMGLLGTVSAVGTALGPSLGGALLGAFGWQSLYVFMAVAGGVALLLCIPLLPSDRPAASRPAFDLPGNLLLAGAVAAYALAAALHQDAVPYGNGLLLALAVLLLVAFVKAERRAPAPLVDLGLLLLPGVGLALLSLSAVSALLMATLVVGPFYLRDGLGLAPLQIGLLMSVGPVVSAISGIPAGRFVDRAGAGGAARIALVGIAAGSAGLALLPPLLGVAGYGLPLVLLTASYALFQAANNTGLMVRAGATSKGVVAALIALSRNLGLVTGAAVMPLLYAAGSAGRGGLPLSDQAASGLFVTFLTGALAALTALVALSRQR